MGAYKYLTLKYRQEQTSSGVVTTDHSGSGILCVTALTGETNALD